ncbi:MAG: hypothetical protein ABIP45_09645 [Knoellia sp.]
MSDSRGYAGPDEALAAVEAQAARAEPQAERARAWSEEVAKIQGVGHAESGKVQATVDIQGLLTGLSVSDAVASLGGRKATRAIQGAVRAAQESVRQQAVQSSERMWGPGSPTTDAFRAEVEAATPLIEIQPLESDGRTSPGGPGSRPSNDGGTW